MNRMILIACVLMTAGVMAQDAKKPIDKAFAPLQGTWTVTNMNGQSFEGMGSMVLVFKDDTYQQLSNGTTDETGHVKLDASKKPMTIDLSIESGNDAGKLQLGIIEITGDTMKLKLSAPNVATRPTTFAVEQGSAMVTATKGK